MADLSPCRAGQVVIVRPSIQASQGRRRYVSGRGASGDTTGSKATAAWNSLPRADHERPPPAYFTPACLVASAAVGCRPPDHRLSLPLVRARPAGERLAHGTDGPSQAGKRFVISVGGSAAGDHSPGAVAAMGRPDPSMRTTHAGAIVRAHADMPPTTCCTRSRRRLTGQADVSCFRALGTAGGYSSTAPRAARPISARKNSLASGCVPRRGAYTHPCMT
jgi:hypothetical protein